MRVVLKDTQQCWRSGYFITTVCVTDSADPSPDDEILDVVGDTAAGCRVAATQIAGSIKAVLGGAERLTTATIERIRAQIRAERA